MNNFPVIRLELEGMKQSILTALTRYNSEIEEFVEQRLEYEIKNFDYEGLIQSVAHDALSNAIKGSIESYFRYGEGRKAIDAAIRDAFVKIVDTPEE